MDLPLLATYVKQALTLVLLLSMPTVVAVGLVGLVIAFLQAVTQVQDQTMAFSIKLIVAILVIATMSGWLGGELFSFADGLFSIVAKIR